jgi:hypothetical protein
MDRAGAVKRRRILKVVAIGVLAAIVESLIR